MSHKIGWRHIHARDGMGFTGCHVEACRCARCLLEDGSLPIPKERRSEVEQYREHVSEMYKCEKCKGLRVSLIKGDAKRKIPDTLWCMTCGHNQMPSGDQSERLVNRLAQDSTTGQPKPRVGLSLRERLAASGSSSQVVVNADQRASVPSRTQQQETRVATGGNWTPEERRDLKAMIDKHGTTSGIKAYLAKYPERGRTDHGCAYQWNTQIRKGKGI